MGGYLPEVQQQKFDRDIIRKFDGYNHNLVIDDGDTFEELNLSSDKYPVLSVRNKRAIIVPNKTRYPEDGDVTSIFSYDTLYHVSGTSLYRDAKFITDVSEGKKRFVAMGAWIIIFPDKIMYNPQTEEVVNLENEVAPQGNITVTLCDIDTSGNVVPYDDYTSGASAPQNPVDGQYWIDTSKKPYVLRRYSVTQAMWIAIPTVYLKMEGTGIGSGFSKGDGVSVSGFTEEHSDLNASYVLQSVSDNYIVVIGIITETITAQGITVSRKMPEFDYICEFENRLYACSSKKHEIYASVLGDPKNWNVFQGISTDSYVATVGTPSEFTGCIGFRGNVLFFKEDYIHILYGTMPSKYQIDTLQARGVQKGSDASLCIVNETLYYKTLNGVCAFNMSLPSDISFAFGGVEYYEATAGRYMDKYYISCKDSSGNGNLFCFDTRRNCWHKEDNIYISCFASLENDLYMLHDKTQEIYTVGGSHLLRFEDGLSHLLYKGLEMFVPWHAQFGVIGLDLPDAKYVSQIKLRIWAEAGAHVCVSVQYDDVGDFICMWDGNMTATQSFEVPIIPRRCDTMRIRLDGVGSFRMYSIAKSVEQGGV